MTFSSGGTGAGAVGTSTDVALNNTADNDTLVFESSTQKWTNTANAVADNSISEAKLSSSVRTSLDKADAAVTGIGITHIEAVSEGQAGSEPGVLYVEFAT